MKAILIALTISLLLLSIFFVIESYNNLSGFVVFEPEKSLGVYSLNPSFKIKFNYELTKEYEMAISKTKAIIESCKDRRNIKVCLNERIKSENFVCENNLEDIFYELVEQYKECLSLKEDNVACMFSVENKENIKGVFEVNVKSVLDETVFEMGEIKDFVKSGLYYTNFDNKEGIRLNSAVVKLDYRDEPKIESIRAGEIELSKIALYKNHGRVMFIERGVESNFRTLKPIALPRKKGVKVCIRSNTLVNAYDADKVKARNVVYKFAIKYPEFNIPAINSFEVEDKLMAENSIMLRWNKVDGNINIDHYNIYCSENEFSKDNKEIILDSPTLAVYPNSNPDEWKIDLDKCNDNPIKDGKTYYFAVTAATQDAEGPAIISKSGISRDDLAPGIINFILADGTNRVNSNDGFACIQLKTTIKLLPFKVEHNEDRDAYYQGTQIQADEKLTYILHYYKDIPVKDNLGICDSNCRVVANTYPISFDINNQINGNKFVTGNTYCFTLVAKDGDNNVVKQIISPYRFIKPSQWDNLESFRKVA